MKPIAGNVTWFVVTSVEVLVHAIRRGTAALDRFAQQTRRTDRWCGKCALVCTRCLEEEK